MVVLVASMDDCFAVFTLCTSNLVLEIVSK